MVQGVDGCQTCVGHSRADTFGLGKYGAVEFHLDEEGHGEIWVGAFEHFEDFFADALFGYFLLKCVLIKLI